MLIVSKPTVDLRQEPREIHPRDYSLNRLRLTQCLYGEQLKLLEDHDDYFYVESLEQEHFTIKEGWHGYRGFVHTSEVIFSREVEKRTHVVNVAWTRIKDLSLSFGTYLTLDEKGFVSLADGRREKAETKDLRPLHSPFCRKRLVHDSRHFMGIPYLWGGSAAFDQEMVSSVDCSALIYLLYRAQGMLIPRDAHPQMLKGRKINKEELQPGDLIYLNHIDHPGKASHVILYKDKKTFLESPRTGETVRMGHFDQDYYEEEGCVKLHGKHFLPTYISFS